MRYIKALPLAALAVFALVAFAGAGTASATMLCDINATPCPSANTIPSGTTITGSLATGTDATLTTTGGFINPVITCTTSTTSLQTTSNGGGTGVNVTGNITALSFTGCTSTGPSGCDQTGTVLTTSLPAAGSVAYTSGMNGTVSIPASPKVTFTCPDGFGGRIDCIYGGNAISGTLVGGNPAHITFNNVAITQSGGSGFCPTDATWTATYVATGTMTSIWVADS